LYILKTSILDPIYVVISSPLFQCHIQMFQSLIILPSLRCNHVNILVISVLCGVHLLLMLSLA